MPRVIIIGAGLTGLSVAYHLEQQNFFDYQIFEAETEIGGLCRSVRQDGFTFDYTGHLLHGFGSDQKFLDSIMGSETLIKHKRYSAIYSEGIYTAYPYQTNLYGLSATTIMNCIEGYVNRPAKRTAPKNYASWVHAYFGEGFAKHFFFPYQEKIFAYPVNKLRTGWLDSIPSTSLHEILQGTLAYRDCQESGYNAHFLYPQQGGIDHVIKKIAKSLRNSIRTSISLVAIDRSKKFVTLSDGQHYYYDKLILTIPLNETMKLLGMKESEKLLCNSVININLGIANPSISTNHWTYFPEKEFIFFRIGTPHLLGPSMAPDNCSSLSIEIAQLKEPTADQVKHISEIALSKAQKLFNFSFNELKTQKTLVLKHAYVIYDKWREENLERIVQQLKLASIYSVGRYGSWHYSCMHDAVHQGASTALTIMKELT